MHQQQSQRAAIFGASGTAGLDEDFATSIGNMNDTIEDAEELVHNQEKIFSDIKEKFDYDRHFSNLQDFIRAL